MFSVFTLQLPQSDGEFQSSLEVCAFSLSEAWKRFSEFFCCAILFYLNSSISMIIRFVYILIPPIHLFLAIEIT